MTFAVVARYTCAEKDADEVRAALLTMREHTRQEPGNVLYVVHSEADAAVDTKADTEATFLLYEQYVDRAGFDAHAASPHFTEHIVGRVRPLLTDRQVQFGTVI